jgi:AcrR family transcriptional regulator
MPKGVPLTPDELSRRRHEIFARTADVFVRRGFRETSMREIAEACGMSKSSLYDYFKTKEEILLWAVEDEIADLTDAAQQIVEQQAPATTRLRQVMRNHLEYLLSRKEFYLKLSFEVQRLAMDSQKRIQRKRHAYQDLVRRLIDEGVREGSFRPVDSLLVTRLLVTGVTPTAITSRPTGTPPEMLEKAFDVILRGIQA